VAVPGARCPIPDCLGVCQSHLNRVACELGRAGFVETVRGNGGGLRLALAEVEAAFLAVLDLYTVHDLVDRNRGLRAVLFAVPP